MKNGKYFLFTIQLLLPVLVLGQNFSLEQLLKSDTSWVIDSVVANKDKFRLQIIYTTIDRTAKGYPTLKKYHFNVNDENYFYPASLAKLPMAVLAIDKLNSLGIEGVSIYNSFKTSSPFAPANSSPESDSLQTRYLSLASHILRTFMLSDNYSPNYLYEFLGHEYLNKRMKELGLQKSIINQRFATGTAETIRTTHPIEFHGDEGEILFYQPASRSELSIKEVTVNTRIGQAHYFGKKFIKKPLDFRYDNYLPLEEIDKLMTAIIFPELNITTTHLNLQVEDYKFLHLATSSLPNTCYYPDYGPQSFYSDNYRKFIMFGDLKEPIPKKIIINNKVGLAYGFISDIAYIKDPLSRVEFMLSVVLYVNEDQILNDGVYQYETIGLPFLGKLGRLVYDYECWMKKYELRK